MKITWYGHSCFLVESAEGSLVFDPYAPGSVPGLSLPELRADAVICSHAHADHAYADGVSLSGRAPSFKLHSLDTWHDELGGQKRGANTMTVLEAEGLRVLHMGDLGHMLSAQELSALGRVDVLLIPVGGYYTIDARQAAELARLIAPGITVPMHYRGEGFGYDVIGGVEEFLALMGGRAERLSVSSFDPAQLEKPVTLILTCPHC